MKRLEYRGYDSAGLAVDGEDNKVDIIKCVGNIDNLKKKIQVIPDREQIIRNHVGIAHTRYFFSIVLNKTNNL